MTEYYAPTTPEVSGDEKKHMEQSREYAGECVVLLENDGTLPLKSTGNIAAYGSGVRHTVKGGTGSGDVNSRTVVTIEQGLKEAAFTITTEDWLTRCDQKLEQASAEYIAWMNAESEKKGKPTFIFAFEHPFKEPGPELITEQDIKNSDTDTAIYVISRNSGEGADRYNKEGDYQLFPEEITNLKTVAAAYKKTIVILNIGGVMDMTALKEIQGINSILLMSQLGNIGGYVLGDVLTGKVNPSGKLTDTWAVRYEDYPSSAGFSHNDGNIDDEFYTEGIYVGYRYFDSFGIHPVYSFGYGKSYTDFAISDVQVKVVETEVQVHAKVTNTGKDYAGKEVVQVYYSAPKGTLEKPYQELAGFAKTKLLQPGESEAIVISFDIKNMSSYSQKKAAWVLEAGEYAIRVGNGSRATHVVSKLILQEEKVTKQLSNRFQDSEKIEEISGTGATLYTYAGEAEEIEKAPEIVLNTDTITMETVTYQGKREEYQTDHKELLTMQDVLNGTCTVEELVSQLSVEEMAEFCVGTMRGRGNTAIGHASNSVPGAAGDSTVILKEKRGMKGMILADGPAGLRLQAQYRTDLEGNLLPGGAGMGDLIQPFEDLPDGTYVDHYQYCTAIPIGWALAQSWNEKMQIEIGEMVGTEMETFHIDLWLAPALNIHRNPLCGRNFEYYSEDPLVSGKTAAAITIGVQKHPGKGTTIKHFAANSQEDNRYFTNSHISERAIREIYLKGFEIAVQESQPFSIMTSYNLMNGIHTANSYDLLQAVARDEWGFKGVVMTDWFTSQEVPAITGSHKEIYPISASTGCIYAGNDMQMPGCQKNVDDIVAAVNSGKEFDGYTITKADLQFNTANVIRIIAKTTV